MFSVGSQEYTKMRQIISERSFSELQQPDKRSFRFINQNMDVENTVAERLGALSSEEFYDLLEPIISQDEWKLIAVGAALGLIAGILQWLLLSSQSLNTSSKDF